IAPGPGRTGRAPAGDHRRWRGAAAAARASAASEDLDHQQDEDDTAEGEPADENEIEGLLRRRQGEDPVGGDGAGAAAALVEDDRERLHVFVLAAEELGVV